MFIDIGWVSAGCTGRNDPASLSSYMHTLWVVRADWSWMRADLRKGASVRLEVCEGKHTDRGWWRKSLTNTTKLRCGIPARTSSCQSPSGALVADGADYVLCTWLGLAYVNGATSIYARAASSYHVQGLRSAGG